jgi:hypothetical protein
MRMHWMATVGILLSAATGAWAEVPITVCGQTVPVTEHGVLAADLTCPTGEGTFAVAVDNGGSLDLAGHTLSGGRTGVRCTKRCTISSTGSAGTIKDSEATLGVGVAAVTDGGKITISNVIVDNHTAGLLTDFDHGKVLATDLTLTNTGIGIQGRKVKLTGLTASGNYTVAQARKTSVVDSTVTASGNSAFQGRVVILMNSSVTGSGSGIDLLTMRRPKVVNSTCEVSRILQNPTETWAVCAND